MEKILRIFGTAITKLYLNYDLHVHTNDVFLEDAILKFCIEYLVEIHITNCHSEIMKALKKTFRAQEMLG